MYEIKSLSSTASWYFKIRRQSFEGVAALVISVSLVYLKGPAVEQIAGEAVRYVYPRGSKPREWGGQTASR